jgi:hypothetical protein
MSVEQDFELCAAVGVASADMTPFDAFLLSAKIIHDQQVLKRKVWKADGTFRADRPDTLDVLEEMTDADRDALRDRVLAAKV